MSIGEKIRQLRLSRNCSMEEISEYLGYKNKKSIWEIETGRTKDIGFEKIIKLCTLFNVEESFFKESEDSSNSTELYIPEASPFDIKSTLEKIAFLQEENHRLWRENGLLKAKLFIQDFKIEKKNK